MRTAPGTVEQTIQAATIDPVERGIDASVVTVTGRPKMSHAGLLTAAQVSRGLVRMLFVIVVARLLGPEQFGIYALVLATVEMLAVASGTGYMDYLTREAASNENMGWGLGAQLILLRLGCIVPVGLAGLGLLWSLGYARPVLVFAGWLSLTLIPRSISEAIQGVLRGICRYKEFLYVELAFGFGLSICAVRMVLIRGGVREVIEAELIAACVAAGVGVGLAVRFRTEHFRYLDVKQLLKTSAIFNVYAFVGNLYDRLDIVLLSKLAGNYATGVYSAAYRPLGTIQLLPYGVLFSLLPSLSRQKAGATDYRQLEKAMGILLSAAFFIVFASMVYADPAVLLLFGARFGATAAAIKVLIWAVIFRYLNFALNLGLLAARRERVFVVTSFVCFFVNLIGNIIFIPRYSWRAAAVLTTLTEIVLFAQNIFWLGRSSGRVPRPDKWVRNSIMFGLLLGAGLLAGRVATPVLAGSVCLFLFGLYLYRTGIFDEFAALWNENRVSGLEVSNS